MRKILGISLIFPNYGRWFWEVLFRLRLLRGLIKKTLVLTDCAHSARHVLAHLTTFCGNVITIDRLPFPRLLLRGVWAGAISPTIIITWFKLCKAFGILDSTLRCGFRVWYMVRSTRVLFACGFWPRAVPCTSLFIPPPQQFWSWSFFFGSLCRFVTVTNPRLILDVPQRCFHLPAQNLLH